MSDLKEYHWADLAAPYKDIEEFRWAAAHVFRNTETLHGIALDIDNMRVSESLAPCPDTGELVKSYVAYAKEMAPQ